MIGQESYGGVDRSVSDHHGDKMSRGANGVEARGGGGEMLVPSVRGDPQKRARRHLQRRQPCVSCVQKQIIIIIMVNIIIIIIIMSLKKQQAEEEGKKNPRRDGSQTHCWRRPTNTCVSFDELFERVVLGFEDQLPLAPLAQILQQGAGE